MDKKVLDKVFDKPTLLNIHSLFNKGIFQEFGGPIADGKEARVFTTNNDKKLAVKVYRVDAASFETIHKYIKGDPRFWNAGKGKRNIVNLWVKKEFRNLKRMYGAKISVPKPLAFRGNVLVMEFIGGEVPAPQLRDAKVKDMKKLFWDIVDDMKKSYRIAKLVHADLSEYNILIHENKHIIIDVGQAVDIRHPKAKEFLIRDIENIHKFFSKHIKASTNDILEEILKK